MRSNLARDASPPPERMGCEEYEADVPLYADGELGEAERVGLELHLASCAACRRGADFCLRFKQVVRSRGAAVVSTPAPASLRARVRVSLDAEPHERSISARLRRLITPLPVAAAGATAVGVTAWMWFAPPPDDVLRDLVARHSRRLPMEIQSSDPQSLESWLSDKVDFHFHVPRIAAPVGARLSHVRDRSAVYLLYGHPRAPNRRISLLVFDEPSGGPPIDGERVRVADHDVFTANRAGYNVAVWRQDEVVYSLVSDSDEDVLELVKAAASP